MIDTFRLCTANGNVAYSRGCETQVKVVVESVFTVNNMGRRFASAFDVQVYYLLSFNITFLLSICFKTRGLTS